MKAIRLTHVRAQMASTLAGATWFGRPPQPLKFKLPGLLTAIGRRVGWAEILGKLPGVQRKVRVSLDDWSLDWVFLKDLVQLGALPSKTLPEDEPVAKEKYA